MALCCLRSSRLNTKLISLTSSLIKTSYVIRRNISDEKDLTKGISVKELVDIIKKEDNSLNDPSLTAETGSTENVLTSFAEGDQMPDKFVLKDPDIVFSPENLDVTLATFDYSLLIDPSIVACFLCCNYFAFRYCHNYPNRAYLVFQAKKIYHNVNLLTKTGTPIETAVSQSMTSDFKSARELLTLLLKAEYLQKIVSVVAGIILSFYIFGRSNNKYKNIPFLWIPDISKKDPLYILPTIIFTVISYSVVRLPVPLPTKFVTLTIVGTFSYLLFSKLNACNILPFMVYGLCNSIIQRRFALKPINVKPVLTKINTYVNKKNHLKSSKEEYSEKLQNPEFFVPSKVTKNSFAPKDKKYQDFIRENKII